MDQKVETVVDGTMSFEELKFIITIIRNTYISRCVFVLLKIFMYKPAKVTPLCLMVRMSRTQE